MKDIATGKHVPYLMREFVVANVVYAFHLSSTV